MKTCPFASKPLQTSTEVKKEIGTKIFIIQMKPLNPFRLPSMMLFLISIRRVIIIIVIENLFLWACSEMNGYPEYECRGMME